MSHFANPGMSQERVGALAEQLSKNTNVLPHEREAMLSTEAFREERHLFELLAKAELLGVKLHKNLVEWHTRYPAKPSLPETDRFWADLKSLRAVKEELQTALDTIKSYEGTRPTLRTTIEHATGEAGDIEKYFSSYLDRVNER